MEIWSSAVMLFLIMDPLGNLPVFISILNKVSPERRKKVLIRELLIALVIMLTFLFAGQVILNILGLKQASVSIAGGIILMIIAIRMIFPPGRGSVNADDESENEEPFIVPLAVPLVAGPSLMAAVILLSNHNNGHYLISTVALCSAWLISSLILMCSETLMKLLGKGGLIALERLMGMILVMLSVQMFLDGIMQYLLVNANH